MSNIPISKKDDNPICFLKKHSINPKKLDYIENEKDVYANLFEIKLTKDLKLYKYPYSVFPDIGEGDFRIRKYLFRSSSKSLKKIYGECFISGDALYSRKKIEDNKTVNCKLNLKGIDTEYFIQLQKYTNERTIKTEDIKTDPLTKQYIELLIKEILHTNPKLEFYKGFFVLKKDDKINTGNGSSISFYPGYATSFMETDKGNYLNVTIKNKILQNNSILDYLRQNNYTDKGKQEDLANKLKNRSFRVDYSKKNYKIYDILFNRNPTNQTFNYEGGTVKLIDYYENIKKLKIRDPKQPIIVVKTKGPQEEERKIYFIPEHCYLSGLEDNDVKNNQLMKNIAQFTKLDPNDKVKKINQFLELLVDDTKNKDNESAKEKSEEYGIQVLKVTEYFKTYYMKEPILKAGHNQKINVGERVFPVAKKIDMINWICLYKKKNYNDADNLYNTLKKASKGFGITIKEPEWIEMPNNAFSKDWTSTAEDYIGKGKDDYSFAVFLIDQNDQAEKNEKLYSQLKKHSLCKSGYVSQVIKVQSLRKKRSNECLL